MPTTWYLSFAEKDRWLGAVLVECEDFIDAVRLCHQHKCNPGGQVKGFVIDEATSDEHAKAWVKRMPRLKLLTLKDLDAPAKWRADGTIDILQ